MNINEIRRRNLDSLIGEPGRRGRIIDFANRYELDASYISQILNKNRNMGEKAARKLEKAIKKPDGYLDIPNNCSPNFGPLRPDQIAILQGYESASPELREAARRVLQVAVDSKD